MKKAGVWGVATAIFAIGGLVATYYGHPYVAAAMWGLCSIAMCFAFFRSTD